MTRLSIIDHPDVAIVGTWALLDVPAIGLSDGWLELGSRLTVSLLLLIGLYFLNKMKEASEAKREQALKALISNTNTTNQQIKDVYEARIKDMSKTIEALESERRELQSKLLER